MEEILRLLFEPCPPTSYGIAWAEDIADSQVELAQEAISLVLNDLQASKNNYEKPVATTSLLLSPHYTDLGPAECADGRHLMQDAPQPLSASMPEDNTKDSSSLNAHHGTADDRDRASVDQASPEGSNQQNGKPSLSCGHCASFTLFPLDPSIDVLSRLPWTIHGYKRYDFLCRHIQMCGVSDYLRLNVIPHQEWDKQVSNANDALWYPFSGSMHEDKPGNILYEQCNGLFSMPTSALYSHGAASATLYEKNECYNTGQSLLMYPETLVTTLGAQKSRSVTIDLMIPFDGGGAVDDPITNAHNDGDREELGLETCCHNLAGNHNLSLFATTCRGTIILVP
jgi:hypothetical protein